MHSIPPDRIGRYDIVRQLGQGAMGRVLLARDEVLDRQVAIKLLRDDLGLSPEQHQQLVERMRQEARASARIAHPNIVALFDMGEQPGVGLFLVFEYVEGPTLKDQIAAGGLSRGALGRLALELGSALHAAHSLGVLHRDIKPENVILSPTGGKIADFGIARIPESTLTRDGRLLGTPAYSAPESLSTGQFSPASDQFSLAATLYEALSLERAFPGDDAVAVASRITTSSAAPVADRCNLDPEIDRVLGRAMARDPKHRYPSADDFGRNFALALGEAAAGFRTIVPTMAPPPVRSMVVGPRPMRVAVGAAVAGAVLMGILLHLGRSCQSESNEPTIPSTVIAPEVDTSRLQPPVSDSPRARTSRLTTPLPSSSASRR
jgi:eukaryotic-like serine/threonine-protein kinase